MPLVWIYCFQSLKFSDRKGKLVRFCVNIKPEKDLFKMLSQIWTPYYKLQINSKEVKCDEINRNLITNTECEI